MTKSRLYHVVHHVVHLGLNVSSSALNCGCVVDGGNAMYGSNVSITTINNNTQITAIVLPPSTTHPQLRAELLTIKPKCTIA